MHVGLLIDRPHVNRETTSVGPSNELVVDQAPAQEGRGDLQPDRGSGRDDAGAMSQDFEGMRRGHRVHPGESTDPTGPSTREGGHAHALPGAATLHRGVHRGHGTGLLYVHIDRYIWIRLQ